MLKKKLRKANLEIQKENNWPKKSCKYWSFYAKHRKGEARHQAAKRNMDV